MAANAPTRVITADDDPFARRVIKSALQAAGMTVIAEAKVADVVRRGSAVVRREAGTVTLVAEARTSARTGVEMEAMVACSVGALAVYDMVKGIEPGVVIERVELLDKTGGKSDFHRS